MSLWPDFTNWFELSICHRLQFWGQTTAVGMTLWALGTFIFGMRVGNCMLKCFSTSQKLFAQRKTSRFRCFQLSSWHANLLGFLKWGNILTSPREVEPSQELWTMWCIYICSPAHICSRKQVGISELVCQQWHFAWHSGPDLHQSNQDSGSTVGLWSPYACDCPSLQNLPSHWLNPRQIPDCWQHFWPNTILIPSYLSLLAHQHFHW